MLMSAKETARYLNINTDTFRELRRLRPDFPGPVTKTKFSRLQVDRWLMNAPAYMDALKQAKNLLRSPTKRERIITRDW